MRSRLVCLGLSAIFLILPMLGLFAGNANAAAITWVGNVNSTWNTSTANWTDGVDPALFVNGDHVTFDDTSTNLNPVTLIGTPLQPGSITVNASRDYTFSGGTTSTGNRLGGTGGIIKNGTGTLTINAYNTFNGAVTINGGIVKLGHLYALGVITGGGTVVNGGTTLSPGGTLDLFGAKDLFEVITVQGVGVDGKGVLVNTVSGNAFVNKLVLAGDSTLGGSQRVDIRGTPSFGNYTLTVDHTASSTVNNNGVRITNIATHDLLNATVLEGALSFHNSGLGKANGTITVTENPATPAASKSTLYLYNTSGVANWELEKNLVFTGGRLLSNTNITGSTSSYTIAGTMTLNDLATEVYVQIANSSMKITAAVTGTGGITKTGPGSLTLQAANTYSGDTIVAAGSLVLDQMASISDSPLIDVQTGATFDVSAVTGGFTLVDGQTLMGNGTVAGGVLAADGSIIEPGASIGTLTVNGNLALAGTLLVEYDGATIDTLVVNGDLNLDGGTFDFSQFGATLTEESYVFATFTGTRTGMAAATAPANYVIAYDDLGKTVALVLVPEPSSFALLFLGLLGFVARRRRP